MKRLISVFLVIVMMSMFGVGCSKKENTNTESDSNNVSTTTVTESTTPYDPIIDTLDFDGLELTFYYADLSDATRLEFDGQDYGNDGISKVIYERNLATEEKFNLDLSFNHIDGHDMIGHLRSDYRAEDPTNDIIAAYAYYGVELALEGIYSDLYTIDYLDTQSTWWNKSYVNSITYQNRLFNIVGDMTPSVTSKTMATFVNKGMLHEEQMGNVDLFSVVENGEWTLEYMMNMCKDVYHESDDVDGMSDGDTYGFILGQISQPAEALLVSFGFEWSKQNEDDSIELTLGSAKNIDIFTKLETFYSGNHIGIHKMPAEEEFAAYGAQNYSFLFASEKTMITIAPLYTAENIRTTDVDYLMLPVPKYDESQTEYRTSTLDSHCNIGISAISDAKKAAGAVLEYMGYLSEKDLTPAYFDVSYKIQYVSDPNTMKLFDMVVDSVVFDFVRTYSRSIKDVTKKMQTIVKDSEPISSGITTAEAPCQVYLDALVKKFQDLYE